MRQHLADTSIRGVPAAARMACVGEVFNGSPKVRPAALPGVSDAVRRTCHTVSQFCNGMPVSGGFVRISERGSSCWLEDLIDTGRNVEVTFEHGSPSSFGIVVGADGIHSTTRRAAFGPESSYRRHFGVYYAILQLPAELGVTHQSRTYDVPGRMATISDFGDRTLGWLAFRSPEIDHDHRDLEQQVRLIPRNISDVRGWRVAEIMEVVAQASDFYFDSVSQIHMHHWSRGRVVLAGDAAHAASLFSGRGTSLAMMGADILTRGPAGCVGDMAGAFARYEEAACRLVAVLQDPGRDLGARAEPEPGHHELDMGLCRPAGDG